ncbi:hypothetical protein ACLOJK_000541 [Asimina triloba]
MRVSASTVIACWRSSTNPAPGPYALCLSPPEYEGFELVHDLHKRYWSTGSWRGSYFAGVSEMTVPYVYSFRFEHPFTRRASFLYDVAPPAGGLLTSGSTPGRSRRRTGICSSRGRRTPTERTAYAGSWASAGAVATGARADASTDTRRAARRAGEPGITPAGANEPTTSPAAKTKVSSMWVLWISTVIATVAAPATGGNSRKSCEEFFLKNCSCLGLSYDARIGECKALFGNPSNLRNSTADRTDGGVFFEVEIRSADRRRSWVGSAAGGGSSVRCVYDFPLSVEWMRLIARIEWLRVVVGRTQRQQQQQQSGFGALHLPVTLWNRLQGLAGRGWPPFFSLRRLLALDSAAPLHSPPSAAAGLLFQFPEEVEEAYASKKVSSKEVQELVKGNRKVPLIIDFYATWCGPCILMAQVLETVLSSFYMQARTKKSLSENELEQAVSQKAYTHIPTTFLNTQWSLCELSSSIRSDLSIPLDDACSIGFCALSPEFPLAVEYEQDALFVKVDTDDEYEFSRDMQVRGLPTLLFVSPDPSKDAIRTEGLVPMEMIRDIINNEMLGS